jgi:phospholipid/cholesterol/gamma-HCH transport system substrate-binding protein
VAKGSAIGRTAAFAAIFVAVVAVVVIIAGGGSSYTIYAIFQNASQIVAGDEVQVSGNSIGTVSNIQLTSDGLAKLTLSIADSTYDPLHEGTLATVRASSLSGIANRYVDLRLGPASAPNIADGGTIGTNDTTSAVDLDEIFNTLNQSTRNGLRDFIRGSASEYAGNGKAANLAWQYLNPAIASASTLFAEVNRDTPRFTNFITKTGNLVSDIAQRGHDLTGLISHLDQTTSALADQHPALGQAIDELPNFMALADTTFTNLRAALDDLTPLINDSKPVAPKLQALLQQLRPLAQQAVPTVRNLANIVSRPGPDNDLIDLTRLGVPLAAVTVHHVKADGAVRPGAFPQSVTALAGSTPELAIARPYAVDLTGWFDGFSHPGLNDANGAASRVAPVVGAFSLGQTGTFTQLPVVQRLLNALTGPNHLLTYGQGDRCPGSQERGAVYYPESGYPCNPSEVPTGP